MLDFPPFFSEEEIQKQRSIAKKLRSTPWWKNKKMNGICYYCRNKFESKELTMDHIIPLSKGGKSIKANLVPCCKKCNNSKKNSYPTDFITDPVD